MYRTLRLLFIRTEDISYFKLKHGFSNLLFFFFSFFVSKVAKSLSGNLKTKKKELLPKKSSFPFRSSISSASAKWKLIFFLFKCLVLCRSCFPFFSMGKTFDCPPLGTQSYLIPIMKQIWTKASLVQRVTCWLMECSQIRAGFTFFIRHCTHSGKYKITLR